MQKLKINKLLENLKIVESNYNKNCKFVIKDWSIYSTLNIKK